MNRSETSSNEEFKGGVHYVAGVVVGAMALHNLGEALSQRGKPRHWCNVVLYGLAVAYEGYNTFLHAKQA